MHGKTINPIMKYSFLTNLSVVRMKILYSGNAATVHAYDYVTNTGFLFLCNLQHYIVYMGEHSHPNMESVVRANHEILASVTGRQGSNLKHLYGVNTATYL
jgi:hypothetical protein